MRVAWASKVSSAWKRTRAEKGVKKVRTYKIKLEGKQKEEQAQLEEQGEK